MKQKEQRPKAAQHAGAKQTFQASDGAASRSSPLLDLQQKAGNAAVSELLLDVQRAAATSPTVTTHEAPADQDLALEIADAVLSRALWESDWRKPDTEGLTPVEGDMVWDLYKAATHHAFSGGPVVGPEASLQDLARGERSSTICVTRIT
jgi:hypothetical protein